MGDYSKLKKSTVARYDISNCGDRNCAPLVLSADGVYVEYDEYEALRAEVERLNDTAKIDSGLIEALKSRLEIDPRHHIDGIDARNATIKGLDGRVDQLKAENERLERNRDMWKGQVERQAEELAALRKDAGRYRWLRDSAKSGGCLSAMSLGDLVGAYCDEHIDDAMSKAAQ
jgi:hypothetical protein